MLRSALFACLLMLLGCASSSARLDLPFGYRCGPGLVLDATRVCSQGPSSNVTMSFVNELAPPYAFLQAMFVVNGRRFVSHRVVGNEHMPGLVAGRVRLLPGTHRIEATLFFSYRQPGPASRLRRFILTKPLDLTVDQRQRVATIHVYASPDPRVEGPVTRWMINPK